MSDLFDTDRPALTPLEMKRMKRRAMEKPRGYAALPGTYAGAEPQTCGSCVHMDNFGRYKKCGLVRGAWTHGRATDILVRTPACRRWESKE